MQYERVVRRIEACRKERGLTIEAAAEITGVSKGTWINMIKGTTIPQLSTLECISEAFGLDGAYLISGGAGLSGNYDRMPRRKQELLDLLAQSDDELDEILLAVAQTLTSLAGTSCK